MIKHKNNTTFLNTVDQRSPLIASTQSNHLKLDNANIKNPCNNIVVAEVILVVVVVLAVIVFFTIVLCCGL